MTRPHPPIRIRPSQRSARHLGVDPGAVETLLDAGQPPEPITARSLQAIRDYRADCPLEVLAQALAASQLPRGVVATRCPRSGRLRVAATQGFDGFEHAPRRVALLEVMEAAALVHGPQVRLGASETQRPDLVVDAPGLGAVLACPVVFRGRIVGAVALEDPFQPLPPRDDTLTRVQRVLAAWAEPLARALYLAARAEQAPCLDFRFTLRELRCAGASAAARGPAVLRAS